MEWRLNSAGDCAGGIFAHEWRQEWCRGLVVSVILAHAIRASDVNGAGSGIAHALFEDGTGRGRRNRIDAVDRAQSWARQGGGGR